MGQLMETMNRLGRRAANRRHKTTAPKWKTTTQNPSQDRTSPKR
jgi:hypothetical protein